MTTQPVMPRVECPVCGRTISLTAAGNIRQHRHPRHNWPCPASHNTVARATTLAAVA